MRHAASYFRVGNLLGVGQEQKDVADVEAGVALGNEVFAVALDHYYQGARWELHFAHQVAIG